MSDYRAIRAERNYGAGTRAVVEVVVVLLHCRKLVRCPHHPAISSWPMGARARQRHQLFVMRHIEMEEEPDHPWWWLLGASGLLGFDLGAVRVRDVCCTWTVARRSLNGSLRRVCSGTETR